MNNQFLDLINNPVLNIDNTIRYSLMYQVKEESLSHHISEVSILAYLTTLKLNSYGENLDVGLVLEKVVLHDLDEVLTGDIPRTTKYYTEEGLRAMRDVADKAMSRLSSQLEGGDKVLEKWRSAKTGKEGQVLELCDMLCVARKVVNEVKILGNGYFLKVAYEMLENLKELSNEEFLEFNSESRNYISGLIHDAIEVMHGLISGDDRLERYGIINNIFMKDKVGVK